MSAPAAMRCGVARLAYALGIALYIGEDGRISQNGPGERIEPAPGAKPTGECHGRGADIIKNT